MPFDESVLEEEVIAMAEDFFRNAPNWDDLFGSGSWYEGNSRHGDFSIVLPLHYDPSNGEMVEWLSDYFPTMYAGDNSEDERPLQAYMNGWIAGIDELAGQVECVRVTFERYPSDDDVEDVIFQFHFNELKGEE